MLFLAFDLYVTPKLEIDKRHRCGQIECSRREEIGGLVVLRACRYAAHYELDAGGGQLIK